MAAYQTLLVAFLSVAVLVECRLGGGGGVLNQPAMTDISGGNLIDITEVPWQAFLHVYDQHTCGAIIISDRWVLSAAQCTFGVEPSQIQLRVGSNSNVEGGSLYDVEEIVNHENYKGKTLDNDISALKTKSVIEFSRSARSVTLPKLGQTRPPVGASVKVSGWGLMEGRQSSTSLRGVDIAITDFEVCKDFYKYTDALTQICAGTSTRKICVGDFGGPLVKGELLVGIASYTNDLCNSPADGYSDVAAYRGWIVVHTGV